jgi:hypothetical protein
VTVVLPEVLMRVKINNRGAGVERADG